MKVAFWIKAESLEQSMIPIFVQQAPSQFIDHAQDSGVLFMYYMRELILY